MHFLTLSNVLLGLAASAAVAVGGVSVAKFNKTRKTNKSGVGDVFDQHRTAMANEPIVVSPIFSGGKLADDLRPSQTEDVAMRQENDVAQNVTPNGQHKSRGLLDSTNRGNISEAVWQFLEQRISEIESEGGDQYGLKRIDLYVELESIIENAQFDEKESLLRLRKRLFDEATDAGFEILDNDVWNPESQRAVVVSHSESEKEIRILKTVTVGVKHFGKLIRKQEVSIITPKEGE